MESKQTEYQMDIIEKNSLIAEFMGGKLKYYNVSNEPYYLMPDRQQWMPQRLQYHTSWDWLMPAWIKFRWLDLPKEYTEIINDFSGCINYLQVNLCKAKTPSDFFPHLVKAIQWYNKEHK